MPRTQTPPSDLVLPLFESRKEKSNANLEELPLTPEAGSCEEAQIIRNIIQHEDELVNHRITWFAQTQAFTFAALAFAWKESDAVYIVYILSLVGAVLSLSSMVALSAGDAAITRTMSWWEKRKKAKYTGYDGPDVIGLIGRKPLYFKFFRLKIETPRILYPWNLLPRLFILVWLFVLVVFCTHSHQ